MDRIASKQLVQEYRRSLRSKGCDKECAARYSLHVGAALALMESLDDVDGLARAYSRLQTDAQRETLRNAWSLFRNVVPACTLQDRPVAPGTRDAAYWRPVWLAFASGGGKSLATCVAYQQLVAPALRRMASFTDTAALVDYYERRTLPGTPRRSRFRTAWNAFARFCATRGVLVAQLPPSTPSSRVARVQLGCAEAFARFRADRHVALGALANTTQRIYTSAVKFALSCMTSPTDSEGLERALRSSGSFSTTLPAAWSRFVSFCDQHHIPVAQASAGGCVANYSTAFGATRTVGDFVANGI